MAPTPRPRSTWAASRSSTATAWNGPWRSRLATRRRATGVSRSGHSCTRPTSNRDRLAGRPAAGPGGARCAGAALRPLRRLRGRRPGGAGGGHGPVAGGGVAGESPRGGGPENPGGWLVTVASRRLSDQLRSDAARRRREEADAIRTTRPPAGPTGDDTLTLLF